MKTMSIWTIYDKPKDFPTKFVARKFLVSGDGVKPTDEIETADTLHQIRRKIPQGLARFERSPGDVKSVVESWI